MAAPLIVPSARRGRLASNQPRLPLVNAGQPIKVLRLYESARLDGARASSGLGFVSYKTSEVILCAFPHLLAPA